MIRPPYEIEYPEGVFTRITIKARRFQNGVWEVFCPEWKCTLHSRNLTRCIALLISEIETHNESEELAKTYEN